MKTIRIILFVFIGLTFASSCAKKKNCPTYKDMEFLSEKKYKKQIKAYQSGKLTKKMKEKQKKASGDGLRDAKKKQTKPVPK
ncbi:MAG: hypothetical protein KA797_01115 [Chitinophagales bacterium]|nr:hypothetical protein [Chitinophagales bacterium]